MANRLVIDSVNAGYASVRVLHEVSLYLSTYETVVLLGTNGNGKSTLMNCIMGVVRSDAGQIYLEIEKNRLDLSRKTPEQIVNLGVSLVPEGRKLFHGLTVQENLLMGAYRRAARKELKENLNLCFQSFPVLEQRKSQIAGTLSGGEQQMLAIARAIMSNPQILLVDEPSVGLAPIIVRNVMTKIKELQRERGLGVLMTEQNFSQAIKIADRGYILVQGKVKFEGKNAEALSANELVKNYYLGAKSVEKSLRHASDRKPI